MYAPRRNWDSPNPFLPFLPFPSPQKQVGGGTLACGWGVGGSPNPDEGHTLWYSLYVRTLCSGPSPLYLLSPFLPKNEISFPLPVTKSNRHCHPRLNIFFIPFLPRSTVCNFFPTSPVPSPPPPTTSTLSLFIPNGHGLRNVTIFVPNVRYQWGGDLTNNCLTYAHRWTGTAAPWRYLNIQV